MDKEFRNKILMEGGKNILNLMVIFSNSLLLLEEGFKIAINHENDENVQSTYLKLSIWCKSLVEVLDENRVQLFDIIKEYEKDNVII